MLKIFIGFDPRQPISYNVLQFSILRRASIPVCITPLVIETLPIKRQGLTPFTWSRFLVPWLCDFKGEALFLDSDMLVLGDVAELTEIEATHPEPPAAWVSKNEHKFEWASAILFNCERSPNYKLTPEYIETANGLHHLNWLQPHQIGDLPREWNHLVGYDPPRTDAKLVHFTQGLPIYPETEGSEYAQAWRDEHKAMNHTESWVELMGRSVHAASTRDGRLVAKLHKDAVR